jgi:hypothetical protein
LKIFSDEPKPLLAYFRLADSFNKMLAFFGDQESYIKSFQIKYDDNPSTQYYFYNSHSFTDKGSFDKSKIKIYHPKIDDSFENIFRKWNRIYDGEYFNSIIAYESIFFVKSTASYGYFNSIKAIDNMPLDGNPHYDTELRKRNEDYETLRKKIAEYPDVKEAFEPFGGHIKMFKYLGLGKRIKIILAILNESGINVTLTSIDVDIIIKYRNKIVHDESILINVDLHNLLRMTKKVRKITAAYYLMLVGFDNIMINDVLELKT